MSAQIIDGKAVAAHLRDQLKDQISAMPSPPGLAVILVGDNPASHVYVSSKVKACHAVGIESFEHRLPADCANEDVAAVITQLNNDPHVHGILLQLPLPEQLEEDRLIQMISPAKDVDGLTFESIGRLVAGHDGFVPCTPSGSLRLIKTVHENLSGMNAVVIGRSLLFGKPMAQLLLRENCTVTTAHSRTKDLPALCKTADILVAAVGRPNMVKADWVKPGAIVIDVGINRLDNGKLTGDVDFDDVKNIAAAITPVPGGVGPMTIAYLLKNTVDAAAK